MTRLAWFCLALWSPVALAQAAPPQPDIHLIWMGGDDCPPCKAWRTTELPQLLAAPDFKGVRFSGYCSGGWFDFRFGRDGFFISGGGIRGAGRVQFCIFERG